VKHRMFVSLCIFAGLLLAVVAGSEVVTSVFADNSTSFSPTLNGTVTINTVGNSQSVQNWTLNVPDVQVTDPITHTVVGEFSYQSDLQVHLKNGQPDFAEGHGTFTGVNASTGNDVNFNLKLTFSAVPTDTQYPYHFIGTFTVTGGTGKFQGAHGGGTINPGGANLNLTAGTGTFFGNWGGTVSSKSL
jgi:hypothetical protein